MSIVQVSRQFEKKKKRFQEGHGRQTFDISGLKTAEDSLQEDRILFEGFVTIRPATSSIHKQGTYHICLDKAAIGKCTLMQCSMSPNLFLSYIGFGLFQEAPDLNKNPVYI